MECPMIRLSDRPSIWPSLTPFSQEWIIIFFPISDPLQ